jgi:hypothetical protein
MLPSCLYNTWTQVTVVEAKDLRQTVATEIGYGDANAWMGWIKYSVRTLNKSNAMFVLLGDQSQVVLFSLGQSLDRDEIHCMLALFQDATAWGNKPCQTLSLLFPEVRGPMGQPPRTIGSLALDINYTTCLSRQGGWLTNAGNLMGCSESQSFNSLTNQSTLSVGRADVWWYCGGPLHETLPGNWAGTCALEQLAIPLTLAFRFPACATHLEKGEIQT